jgi:hypothetical protein
MQPYPQSYPLLKVENPFVLSDDDWPEISKLQRAYSCGGEKSLSIALDELLASDPVTAARVLEALCPPELAPRDTLDDMPELLRKLEILAGEDDLPEPATRNGTGRAHFPAARDGRSRSKQLVKT